MKVFTSDDIFKIHESVINPNELQGLAGDKSLEAVVNRVDNKIHYGLINDVVELVSNYAVVIAVGHVFNDANKRTAYRTMTACLEVHGINLEVDTEEIGAVIVKVAQGLIDEVELAKYFRSKL